MENEIKKNEESREIEVVETHPVVHAGQPTTERRPNVFIGKLNIFNAPVYHRIIREPLARRYHTHYHPRHRHGRGHLIADIFFVVAIIALIGLNASVQFFAGGPTTAQHVALSIKVIPEELRVGDVTTVFFDVMNGNDATLSDPRLTLQLPDGFRIEATDPVTFTPETYTFTLPHIPPHGKTRAAITGSLIGSVGGNTMIRAAVTYRVGETNDRETVLREFFVPLEASAFVVALDLQDEVVHESIVPFTLRYENRGKRPIPPPTIEPIFGDVFTLIQSSIPFADGRFALSELPAGASGTITGTMRVFGGGEAEVIFGLQCFVETHAFCVSEEQKRVRIFYPSVRVTTTAEGGALARGSEGAYVVQYRNEEQEDIVDVVVSVTFPDALGEGAGTVTANSATHPELAVVKQGGDGVVIIPVRLPEDRDRATLFGDGEAVLHVQYAFSYRLASRPHRVITVERSDTVRVVSDLSVRAFGRYYTDDGDQIGRGPIPPRVGETTQYWVILPLANSFSDLDGVVLTAHVPDAVAWTGRTSVSLGDPMEFDARTRTLTWRVGRVTRFTGGEFPDVFIAVELAFTPADGDRGRSPTLIDTIVVRGRDTFADVPVEASAPPVTTALDIDRHAAGNGVVLDAR